MESFVMSEAPEFASLPLCVFEKLESYLFDRLVLI
jgi:hypothetical protein